MGMLVPVFWIWIQILLSTSKKNLTLISTVLSLVNHLLSLKTDVNIPTESNMQKIWTKKIILKDTDVVEL
jgi:hypothetical protein